MKMSHLSEQTLAGYRQVALNKDLNLINFANKDIVFAFSPRFLFTFCFKRAAFALSASVNGYITFS